MSQKTKFAAAAKACRGISSRTKRNACVKSKLKGGRLNDFASPQGRRHRGGKSRRYNPLKGVIQWPCPAKR